MVGRVDNPALYLGQVGSYPLARINDDDVVGPAPAVGHISDVGLGALFAHAVFGGVVHQFGE